VTKVSIVDEALPLLQLALEEGEPILTIVAMGLAMSLTLLGPAAVDAIRRGLLDVWHLAVAGLGARSRDPELRVERHFRFVANGGSPFLAHEESADRDLTDQPNATSWPYPE
jgi:hypothetical protein